MREKEIEAEKRWRGDRKGGGVSAKYLSAYFTNHNVFSLLDKTVFVWRHIL